MDSDRGCLATGHARVRQEATLLAGGLGDLSQRASVYHHLYEDSGGRNVFPLIAAHGALWGAGYFALGMKIGALLSAQYLFQPTLRRERMRQLHAFADAFRDINRRVCIEAYCAYHLSKQFGLNEGIADYVPARLLGALNACHQAQAEERPLPCAQRRALFEAFFLWEQEAIVGPAVERAIAALDWPLIRHVALRPRIEFAYFSSSREMKFSDFASTAERIEKGLRAYEMAEQAGLANVEAALKDYHILPHAFFAGSATHFQAMRERLQAAPQGLSTTS